MSALTAREREVLVLLAQGRNRQQIAVDLGIRANTARTHIQSILLKLELQSQIQAVAYAFRHGLVSPNGDERPRPASVGATCPYCHKPITLVGGQP